MSVRPTIAGSASEIVRGDGSTVHTRDGRALTDLACGFGSVFLGHAHPDVVAPVQHQLGQIWSGGSYPTAIQEEAKHLIADLLPTGFRPCGLYSTGMESVEFALRIAASHTGRNDFVGFACSMHGKSTLTAGLCWENASIGSHRAHTLPFVDTVPEADILDRLATLLATGTIAAVLVEPIQGSNGCLHASPSFYQQLIELCRRYGALSIFDEILTGLYRTGPRFRAEMLQAPPDLLVFAKSIGNGFPVSSVAALDHVPLLPGALPGSTFASNSLAAAAVVATLRVMERLPMQQLVADVGATVEQALRPCQVAGIRVRGGGALWALELGPHVEMGPLLQEIHQYVLVTAQRRFIRVLPAANIDARLLRTACEYIADACIRAHSGGK
ncbi:aminotransferase class III-fold pyridoxal phosphate-dependent enzyme [Lysobacter xanthus]